VRWARAAAAHVGEGYVDGDSDGYSAGATVIEAGRSSARGARAGVGAPDWASATSIG